jgi:hypothetical protein
MLVNKQRINDWPVISSLYSGAHFNNGWFQDYRQNSNVQPRFEKKRGTAPALHIKIHGQFQRCASNSKISRSISKIFFTNKRAGLPSWIHASASK